MEPSKILVKSLETKKEIREICKKKRDGLKKEFCEEKSMDIQKRILSMTCFKEAENILCYSAIRNEPDLSFLMEEALRLGKKVFLPKVQGEDIFFYEVQDLKACEPGAFSIMEPKMQERYKEEDDSSLVLVPGIVFSTTGERIGFGKGFYDRFLCRHKNLLKIGICYDEFITYKWNSDSYDERMNLIVTDKKEVLCDGIGTCM